MARPIVIVNFKTYPQATGEKAVRLAEVCEKIGKQYRVDIRVAVQATDIYRVSQTVKIPVYAQHSSSTEAGQHTGYVTADALKKAGAKGALLNHSEHRLSNEDIVVATALLHKKKLDSIVLVESSKKLKILDRHIKPTFFCIEPPELIAGDVSVSVASPDIVMDAIHGTKRPLLVGAGVRRYTDLEIALEMGARGVILSSGIVLASHKGKAFRKLLSDHPSHRKD